MPDKREQPGSGEKLWVVIGDIHDETDNFNKIPELDQACGIIVTGDLTQLGGVESAKKVMAVLRGRGLPVLAQIGNMDEPEVNDWLTGEGVNLHTVVRELAPGVGVFGIGASTPTPFRTPSEFPERIYAQWLENEWKEAQKFPRSVLVSHNPPKDTVCDEIPSGVHVGSVAVREFLEKCQPDICLCGHIHEGRGIDHVGKTQVLNPGALAAGGYAVLRYENGGLSASLGEIRS